MKKTRSKKADTLPASGSASNGETVLVLRTCSEDMTSFHGFKWPESGPVEAPTEWWGKGDAPHDLKLGWSRSADCGSGLHGLLAGEGDGSLMNWDAKSKWLVIRVAKKDIVDLVGKVKFPRGEVVFCGSQDGATKYLSAAPEGRGRAISGAIITVGRSEAATAGYKGTATAGNWGTATAGNWGTATAGESGTATAGESGTATAGNWGTATAGNWGTATAGYKGTATAGKNGALIIRWWDEKAERYRFAVGYVGEDGIEAGKKYRVESGKIVEVI